MCMPGPLFLVCCVAWHCSASAFTRVLRCISSSCSWAAWKKDAKIKTIQMIKFVTSLWQFRINFFVTLFCGRLWKKGQHVTLLSTIIWTNFDFLLTSRLKQETVTFLPSSLNRSKRWPEEVRTSETQQIWIDFGTTVFEFKLSCFLYKIKSFFFKYFEKHCGIVKAW